MSDSYASQRRHQRVDTTINVRISTIEPERDPWTGRPFFRASHETCANVSRGGAFVMTSEPLRPGRRLLLEMHLPGGEPVEAIGRVAWSKRLVGESPADAASGIGIEFLGGSAEQFAVLEEFIAGAEEEEIVESADG